MIIDPTLRTDIVHPLQVYAADDFRVADGVNRGDAIGPAETLAPGDIYRLGRGSRTLRLALSSDPVDARLTISSHGETGRVGAAISLDCCATFMASDGATVEALIVKELDDRGAAGVHLFPLGAMDPRTPYVLVHLDTAAAALRFAQAACAAFARGTRITMADGRQVPVEALAPGDLVLTRDRGARPLRWIGHQTMRADGIFAPVRIGRGALNNAADLVVGPQSRLFVYQRRDRLGAGRAEVMVRAEYLANGASVTRLRGGYVEYHQLLFDRHEIVYAEGIAAETVKLDVRTQAALPRGLGDGGDVPGPVAVDLPDGAIDPAEAAELLRRASAS